MFEHFRPIGDRVLMRRVESEEKTAGGIFIPDAAKEKSQTCSVIAVVPGRLDRDGKTVPTEVRPGDKVYVGKYTGTEVGDEYLIVREDEILGIIKKA
jgi:chaperonin GroES